LISLGSFTSTLSGEVIVPRTGVTDNYRAAPLPYPFRPDARPARQEEWMSVVLDSMGRSRPMEIEEIDLDEPM